jgi:hypothetical protein
MRSVVAAYEVNKELSKRKSFTDIMIKALSFNERLFRIHPVGDFYSQRYFDEWVLIAEQCEWITFMAYTRNYTLNLSELPKNLKVFYTVDTSTKKLPEDRVPYAIIMPNEYKRKQHRFYLNQPPVQGIICNSNNCLECRYCWFWDGGNVLFPQKYKAHDSDRNIFKHLRELIAKKENLEWLLKDEPTP